MPGASVFPLTRAFARADFRAVGRGGASRRLRRWQRFALPWGAFGTLGGQPHKCGAQPQKCGAQFRKCRGVARKPRTPTQKISKGSQSDPWGDLAWGTWFSQALAGQVVGVRTLRAAPRGFGPKGRRRGPAEGGRGEVNLPLERVLNTPTEGRRMTGSA